MLSRGQIDGEPLLTTRVSLERIDEGFAALKDSTAEALKVLVTPGVIHS
jgi:threonine dehydrogenase-like Zn-dependent dehydrogenase